MLKMPFIHYIDVKSTVMNSVSRKSLDWHPYKSAGHPCSLACPIVICSLLDVTHKDIKNISDEMASFVCLEKQPQSALKMLNMQTMCSSGKTIRAYCSLWAGVVGFVLVLDHDSHRRCCLWNEVTQTEKVSPFSTAYIVRVYNISGVFDFTAHWKEVVGFWHWYHQGMRSPHLFC